MSLRTETVAEFLYGQCERLTYGKCSTRACLLRGGWSPGESQDKATCAPYEIHTELLLSKRKDAALIEIAEYMQTFLEVAREVGRETGPIEAVIDTALAALSGKSE